MRNLFPLLLAVLFACDPSLVASGRPAEGPPPVVQCRDTLSGEAGVTLGHIVAGRFEALSEGAPLPVHAGAQGGYHSDLLVRVQGEGADQAATGAIHLDIDVTSGGWTEQQSNNLSPQCRNLGAPGYYTEVRLYWSPPLDCGEDPCEDDQDSAECWDYEDCLDWGVGLSWSEMSAQIVTLEVAVETVDLDASDVAYDVELTTGEMDDEGGG